MLKAVNCARFTGYRPCEPGKKCEGCPDLRPVKHTTLLVNLDNLGNVIQTTAVLPALRRALPDTFLTWVTLPSAAPVLRNNPAIDRIMPYGFETVSILRAMEFDLLLNVDKSMRSAALASSTRAGQKRGFGLTKLGAVEPLNPEAEYVYRLGLDDDLKFKTNRKPGTQIIAEALGLEWRRDTYSIVLTREEKEFVRETRARLGGAGGATPIIIGLNTGSSPQFPNKSLSVERHVDLVGKIAAALPRAAIALLGGPHETEKNARVAARSEVPVIETPTTEGVRRGLLYVDACDMVLTGDTSALHMAVALGKWVVAYFGVSCAAEIDLYDRGVKVASDLPCSPCWRPSCPDPRCMDELDLDALVRGASEPAPGAQE